jgi:beta-ureidopropionase / N-carbamoyl-L-amino-acid hydrolase
MHTRNLQINQKRLSQRLTDLGAIGATAEGGVCRLAATDDEKRGRDHLVNLMKQAKLEIKIDNIGNIFGIRRGSTDSAPVMTGSHLDTVRNGGTYDGAYGVLAGLEVVETLNDAGITTTRPLVVGAFTNEEGVRFQPDMMGSLVYAGGLELAQALSTVDANGKSLGDELLRIDYAGDMRCGEIVPHAFIELHIEQGPVLETTGICIGTVENLQGISWTEVTFSGQANHAGTTPMMGRRDAGYCAAATAVFVRQLATRYGGNQVSTVGELVFSPNVINVVPSRARMTIDLRNTDNDTLCLAEQELAEFLHELSGNEGVAIDTRSLARFEPVQFDQSVAGIIEQTANRLKLSNRRMTSGAGHDAQMMSRICPAAMIFVPSVAGISHNPKEHTHKVDLVAGANVLLQSMLKLAD